MSDTGELCPYCREWPAVAHPRNRKAGAVTCGRAACRLARQRERNRMHHARYDARQREERALAAELPPTSDPLDVRRSMSAAKIDQLFEAARAERLAREKAAGRRTYTLGEDDTWRVAGEPMETGRTGGRGGW